MFILPVSVSARVTKQIQEKSQSMIRKVDMVMRSQGESSASTCLRPRKYLWILSGYVHAHELDHEVFIAGIMSMAEKPAGGDSYPVFIGFFQHPVFETYLNHRDTA